MKVLFSDEIIRQAEEICRYLEENYSLRSAQNFHLAMWDSIYWIKKQPFAGRATSSEAIRYKLIGRHRRLYYKILNDGEIIHLLEIWDSRQDPTKNKF